MFVAQKSMLVAQKLILVAQKLMLVVQKNHVGGAKIMLVAQKLVFVAQKLMLVAQKLMLAAQKLMLVAQKLMLVVQKPMLVAQKLMLVAQKLCWWRKNSCWWRKISCVGLLSGAYRGRGFSGIYRSRGFSLRYIGADASLWDTCIPERSIGSYISQREASASVYPREKPRLLFMRIFRSVKKKVWPLYRHLISWDREPGKLGQAPLILRKSRGKRGQASLFSGNPCWGCGK